MRNPEEILVRGPNWTGDVIMATPGFRALRAGFREARITLHLRESQIPLVAGAPWFDEVLPVRSWRRRGLAPWLEGRALRRGRRFDLGLCLPDSFSSALLMRAAGVGHVIGYARGGRGPLLHQALALPSERGPGGPMLPRELHVLGLVEAAGCERHGTHLELFVTGDEVAEARAALTDAGVAHGEGYAILAPGASYGPSKIWPPRHFARLGDLLAERGLRPVLVGTRDEQTLVRDVVRAMRAREAPVDLVGRLSLGGLKALVRDARLLVGNDAGARHVAVAFGVPCVVMMGPTSLEKTALNLEGVRVLTADVACRPCYRRQCPIDHRCMTKIGPERALAEALPLLGSGAGTGAVA